MDVISQVDPSSTSWQLAVFCRNSWVDSAIPPGPTPKVSRIHVNPEVNQPILFSCLPYICQIGPPYGNVKCRWIKFMEVVGWSWGERFPPKRGKTHRSWCFGTATYARACEPGKVDGVPLVWCIDVEEVWQSHPKWWFEWEIRMKVDEISPKQSFVLAEPFLWVWRCKRNTWAGSSPQQGTESEWLDLGLGISYFGFGVVQSSFEFLVIGSYKMDTHGLEKISLAPVCQVIWDQAASAESNKNTRDWPIWMKWLVIIIRVTSSQEVVSS